MTVPGLTSDPARMNDTTLWLKKVIRLPAGEWTDATLILKGALFSPAVYINGEKVSQKNGGMAPTFHLLNHPAVKPGNTITLEMALKSLKDIDESDASYVPRANHWRSNISTLVWDDIILRTHGQFRLSRIIPFTDMENDLVRVNWEIENRRGDGRRPELISCEVIESDGVVILSRSEPVQNLTGTITLPLEGKCGKWSPDTPNLYRLRLTILDRGRTADQEQINYGFKTFTARDHQFILNNDPCRLRAGTVVWHRWIRDPEAKYIAFDTDWFKRNVVQLLKDHGANALRFHLGNPPEALLDLCDRYGLLVQYEWSFFHGMPASETSLLEQWRDWLDLAMQHPSVSLIHPYNETSGGQLDVVWSALDQLLKEYPSLVLEDRDVIHIHKYWWSMFENVGLYYDSADEFPKPIMVDEFGGNYLDGYGNPGGYTTLRASFLRFCGREQTAPMRLYHHTTANSQIAEYWRRIGAAGFSPFCIAGSPEDGNHWYLGRLKKALPKDVWDALTAAWSPLSVSLEVWDRNFTPGQTVALPLYLFNDTGTAAGLEAQVYVEAESGKHLGETIIKKELPPFYQTQQQVILTVPPEAGRYTFKAWLRNPPSSVKYPVISQWDFRVIQVKVPPALRTIKIAVLPAESELVQFLSSRKIKITGLDEENTDILLGSKRTWEKIINSTAFKKKLQHWIQAGKSIVLLNAGPQYLGQGYAHDPQIRYGFTQSRSEIKEPEVEDDQLFGGITLEFTTIAEPESHIHPSLASTDLWFNLQKDYTWLWNGLRGGLIAPAADMSFSGLSQAALVASWTSRGADETKFDMEHYYAYELQGFYGFSQEGNDAELQQALREKVRFIVEDAPALAGALNPDAQIKITNLSRAYKKAGSGQAEKLTGLVNCGLNLLRTPVVRIDFGAGKGSLIISQLLTEGRLAPGYGEEGLYGRRYDPAAEQFVLNLLAEAATN